MLLLVSCNHQSSSLMRLTHCCQHASQMVGWPLLHKWHAMMYCFSCSVTASHQCHWDPSEEPRRVAGEHEASRRLKTQLLVEMEGCDPTSSARRVLLVGATNRPEVRAGVVAAGPNQRHVFCRHVFPISVAPGCRRLYLSLYSCCPAWQLSQVTPCTTVMSVMLKSEHA